jgi:hypothetical protein
MAGRTGLALARQHCGKTRRVPTAMPGGCDVRRRPARATPQERGTVAQASPAGGQCGGSGRQRRKGHCGARTRRALPPLQKVVWLDT